VVRPGLEALEDRLAPVVSHLLTWVGPPGGLWSMAANWRNERGFHTIPRIGDQLEFGTIYQVFARGKWWSGTNTSSVDNMPGLRLHSLTIGGPVANPGFTSGVLIAAPLLVGRVSQTGGLVMNAPGVPFLQVRHTYAIAGNAALVLAGAPLTPLLFTFARLDVGDSNIGGTTVALTNVTTMPPKGLPGDVWVFGAAAGVNVFAVASSGVALVAVHDLINQGVVSVAGSGVVLAAETITDILNAVTFITGSPLVPAFLVVTGVMPPVVNGNLVLTFGALVWSPPGP
jgi:hypothetical protein